MRIFLFVLASFSIFAMEPTLPEGRFRFKFTYSHETADAYFDSHGSSILPQLEGTAATYKQTSFDLDMDFGWRPDVTFVAKTRHLSRDLRAEGAHYEDSGFPALYIGLRQRLAAPIQNGALYSEVGFSDSLQAKTGQPLAIGFDAIDWTFLMGYAQDFPPREGGWKFDLGYRFRNGAPADEVLVNAEMKLKISWLGYIAAEMNVVESHKDSQIEYGPLLYPRDGGSQRLGLKFQRAVTKQLELELGYAQNIAGRNQFDQDGIRLGVIYRR